ncbi:antirepressor, partial [Latilactobacillus sakei]|uniref:BRO-N domain-containing protein n=2 Tax=Latilactobacillus sakei TaxID=1599 RepID=UPI000500D53E
MKDLQLFDFNGDQVRTVLIEGEPYFVGKDVADILGYSETNAMTKRLDEEDFISTKLSGMNMKSTIINESGLYAAIIGS